MPGRVYFIGAGPGDPELLTLKGRRLIEEADVIVYADSLVDPRIRGFARPGAEIHGSASMSLEEIIEVMAQAVSQGKSVARVHTGDPAIYGAIAEQMAALDERGVPYEVVPGVSSLFAAAAALPAELTLPEVSQTVIITRREGRTAVPEKEALRELAAHQATMALFLSAGMLAEAVQELREGGYPDETPVAIVYRASWPDQRVVRGTLGDIVEKAHGIRQQAIILVGRVLDAEKYMVTPSRLYHSSFTHGLRQASEPSGQP